MAIKKGNGIESLKKQVHTHVKPDGDAGGQDAVSAGQQKDAGGQDAAAAGQRKNLPDMPAPGRKKQEYLRLDITGYKEYISLMAGHASNTSGKYVSMTQYILRLIEADRQRNISLYEKLEQIEDMKRGLY
ncbi:MAG: hypothetical protein NC489_34965 [Ruminococcus flavefaciens]|nr:hypothetical protein [Ruminococcus flavefaciens]